MSAVSSGLLVCLTLEIATCIGIPPQRTYVALGVSDCALGYPMTPTGSWTLTLTSLTPGSADPINPDILYYIPHGSLIATLPDGDPDGGTSGVSVSLTF